MTRVKICGITRLEDAEGCVALGVDTLGLNFWPGTKRCVDVATARTIVETVGASVEIVAVFVDAGLDEMRRILGETGILWAQLHGRESPDEVRALLPHAYKAVGVGTRDPLDEVRRYPGEHVLLDAAVPGAMPGGTGVTFAWELAREVARERKLTLAGGLHAGNVASAIATVHPYRVDVASGVERAPGIKDLDLVRAFVSAARTTSI